ASAIRLAIGPNPTRSAVVAHASLPDGSGATASAGNVNGRVLRSWHLGRTSGDVELVWDLRDEHGNAVPAGVYWLRVQSGSSRITRSVVVR
ncbi:MAG: hypothetical protein R3E12_18945, partial [Candidatus Eisenbacteria bacterium]